MENTQNPCDFFLINKFKDSKYERAIVFGFGTTLEVVLLL